jgi:hypothetical protein
MYVVAHHTIVDPAKFGGNAQSLLRPPEGIQLHAFLPNTDMTKATCLWEGSSREAVQHLLDSTLGTASQNMCYEVDTKQSLGLPAARVSEAALPA